LPDATATFWSLYGQTAAALFAQIGELDGLRQRQLSAAERRLGFALPMLLRQFFLRVGKRRDLTRKYHRLLSPGELRVPAETLLFFEQSQQVVYWGIKVADVGVADPPVWQANSHTKKRLSWYPDHDHLSDFFITMLYRQFLEYGENSGAMLISKQTLSAIRRGWPEFKLRGKNLGAMELFARDGQALCVFRQGQQLELLAAGRTEQEFLDIGQRLGLVEELCGVEATGDEES
jgi:hypothetical protein